MKNLFLPFCLASLCLVPCTLNAAVTARAGSVGVIGSGTTVGARSTTSVVNESCSETYNSCMDQFCIIDSAAGGRCVCSNDSIELDNQVATLNAKNIAATRNAENVIAAIETGKITRGKQTSATSRGSAVTRMSIYSEPEEEPESNDIADLKGVQKFNAAMELCNSMLPADCTASSNMLGIMYNQQIKSDCAAYKNAVNDMKKQSIEITATASRSVRAAALDSIKTANKLDLGQCILETQKCMTGADVCGKNFENCTGGAERIDINFIKCEHVQQECQAVASQVKPAWLAAFGELIASATAKADSKLAQSCLTDVSNCIHKACQDDIAGKGVDTMDSCLSRPEMAQSFCKVELDRCTAIEPQIWDYTKNVLASMRVDACTEEVKQCFTSEDRCGGDWLQCIGMDYSALHEMCPVDKLVVCKAGNPDFALSDLDSMISGIYLNIDNTMLEKCQELADTRMEEVCGSTTGCNVFAENEDIGATSLAHDKSDSTVSISGVMNWALIDWLNGTLDADGYLGAVKPNAAETDAKNRVSDAIRGVNAEISKTVDLLKTGSPELANCIYGRDMSQINGSASTTDARFPHIMDKYFPVITAAAVSQASLNYANKYKKLKEDIIRDADIMNAEYACYAMPVEADRKLNELGLVKNQNQFETKKRGGNQDGNLYTLTEIVADTVSAEDIAKLAGKSIKNESQGGGITIQYDVSAIFSRETRECRIMTSSSMCTARKFNGDGNGAGLKQMLKTIAVSCAVGAVTAGIGAMANVAQSAKIAAAAKNIDTVREIGDTAVTAAKASGNILQYGDSIIKASRATDAAIDTLEKVTQTAKTVEKVVRGIRVGTSIAAGAAVGAGMGSKTIGDDRLSVGGQVAWMAADIAAGVGAGALCGAIATAFPIGTIAAAAIVVASAVASSTINDENYESSCEAMEQQTETIQF